jgi:predicted nucleic acid-binding protein
MPGKALVVDANILIRAVLGIRTRQVIEAYADTASFFVPEIAYRDAKEHLRTLTVRRGGDPQKSAAFLDALVRVMDLVEYEIFGAFEIEAKKRLAGRDPDDWPILASALALGCPIWTEDTDFFGCGVPTWTSDRVEIFLREQSDSPDIPDPGK